MLDLDKAFGKEPTEWENYNNPVHARRHRRSLAVRAVRRQLTRPRPVPPDERLTSIARQAPRLRRRPGNRDPPGSVADVP